MGPESMLSKITFLLFGAVLGWFSAYLMEYLKTRMQYRREIDSLRAAFYGEVSALLNIVEGLRLNDYIQNALSKLKGGGPITTLDMSVNEKFFNVYYSNLNKIGLLDSRLSERVCSFYTYGLATIEYLNELSTKEWAEKKVVIEEAMESFNQLLHLLDTLKKEGTELRAMLTPNN